MYTKSARFYDALYSWKDYKAEAARLIELIQERNPGAETLLDVACGTGLHLAHLEHTFRAEGLDTDPAMMAIARERTPEIPLHEGDMTGFDLGKSFDVVTCLFSSIGYVETADNLDRAISAMARHLNGGGLLIVEPWFSPEDWEAGTAHALFVDEDDLKIARVNTSDPPVDGLTVMEMHYLVGTPEGTNYFTETHRLKLFTADEYNEAFTRAGVEVEHDENGLMGRGLYIGRKPR